MKKYVKAIKFVFLFASVVLSPVVYAVSPSSPQIRTFADIIDLAIQYMRLIIPLLMGAAVVIFLFGVLKYIGSASEVESREEGRRFMVYGIIGLAVMTSVYGLVAFVTNTLGLPTGAPNLNDLPFQQNQLPSNPNDLRYAPDLVPAGDLYES
jgi:hypothetical protein